MASDGRPARARVKAAPGVGAPWPDGAGHRLSLSLPLRINLISLVFAALVASVLTALGGFFLHDQQTDNATTHARLAADELALRAGRLLEMGLRLDDFIGFDAQCQGVIRNDPLLSAAGIFGPDLKRRFASGSHGPAWPDGLPADLGDAVREVPGRHGMQVVRPILHAGGEPRGHAVVTVNGPAVLQATLSRVAWLVSSALLLFVVGLLIQQGVFWRTVGRPLASLVRTADDIQPDGPVDPALLQPPDGQADDDIGRLYAAFGRLLQRLTDARNQLLAQNEQLEATVRDRTLRLELANAELANDIQRRQQLENELRRVAETDALTGLASRAFVMPHAESRLAQARRMGRTMGVMLFDFDGFKAINDTHGHAVGDQVLCTMATRMAAACRQSDVLARLGGDEFLLVFDGFGDAQQVVPLANRLVAAFALPLDIGGRPLKVGVSIGIALFPANASALPDLLAAADAAMYAVKQDGGGWRFAGTAAAAPQVREGALA